jgi:quinol monooxygenase YgiN
VSAKGGAAMIRHVVMFRSRDPKDREALFQRLSILTGIPGPIRLEVARNEKIDQIGNDVDVVVYGEFADEDALRAYKAHPLYAQSIARVRPLRDMRIAADFIAEIGAGAPVKAAPSAVNP